MDKECKGLEMKQPPERHIRTPWIIRPLLLLVFMLGAASPGCGGNGGDSGTDDGQEDTLEDHDVPVEGQDGDGRDAPEADDAADGDAREDLEDLEEDEGQEAPEPQIAVPCEDGREDIYAALLDDFPPPTAGLRGEIVKCSVERTLSVDDVAQRIEQAGVGDVTAVTGVQLVRITYRTERMGDRPGLGTARAYLPLQSRPGPAPAVVCNHGTIGLADQCAPSNYQFGTALETDTVTDYLTLPFAGRGYVVIAPDYAGLGNEGVQGYGRNDDTAHSVLDASRALTSLVTPGSLSGDIFVTGHSQGGGASLAAQATAEAYGSGGEIVAVIPFAPGWQYAELSPLIFQYPEVIPSTFATLMHTYADAANALGEDRATEYFHPSIREEIESAVNDRCVGRLDSWIRMNAPMLSDLIDADFLNACYHCLTGGICEEPAAGYVERSSNNIMSVDPDITPILLVQGMNDTLVTPGRAACIVDALASDGVLPQLCVDNEANHMDVVGRNMSFVLQWLEALLDGDELPACASEDLPECSEF